MFKADSHDFRWPAQGSPELTFFTWQLMSLDMLLACLTYLGEFYFHMQYVVMTCSQPIYLGEWTGEWALTPAILPWGHLGVFESGFHFKSGQKHPLWWISALERPWNVTYNRISHTFLCFCCTVLIDIYARQKLWCMLGSGWKLFLAGYLFCPPLYHCWPFSHTSKLPVLLPCILISSLPLTFFSNV